MQVYRKVYSATAGIRRSDKFTLAIARISGIAEFAGLEFAGISLLRTISASRAITFK